MNKVEFEEKLHILYAGSGYSMDSVYKHLRASQTRGFSCSYDGSSGMAYFDDFQVFYSPYGFEVITK